MKQERNRVKNAPPGVRLVPLRARNSEGQAGKNRDATFGQRRKSDSNSKRSSTKGQERVARSADGGMEISWVPSSKDKSRSTRKDSVGKRGTEGVESFGLGMEKGDERYPSSAVLSESERSGRTHRRTGVRSGSRNAFRRM
jgi:ribosome biogenesis protein ENP2